MPDPLLALLHMHYEPLGRLEQWFASVGVDVVLCQPMEGDAIPASLDGFSGLVVMGGPQSACGEESAPWIGERGLIREAVDEGLPMLGICLGAQLLAAACGGRVEPAAAGPEKGVLSIRALPAAAGDLLLQELPDVSEVGQWHGDEVIELPPGAVPLAESDRCKHQAFRVGERAWGLQFHPEVTPEIIAGWAAAEGLEGAGFAEDVRDLYDKPDVEQRWARAAIRFASLVV